MDAVLRVANEGDAGALAAIYAPYVRETVISFELEPPDAGEMAGRLAKTLAGHPWLVAEVDGVVAGYAYASKHRERAAYQWSVDVSVYVDRERHRAGLGRALYAALFAILRAQGFVTAYGGITLPNEKSVGLHEAMGFRHLGTYEGVGYKLGGWHPVGWWALRLGELPAEPVAPVPFRQMDARTIEAALAQGLATLS